MLLTATEPSMIHRACQLPAWGRFGTFLHNPLQEWLPRLDACTQRWHPTGSYSSAKASWRVSSPSYARSMISERLSCC